MKLLRRPDVWLAFALVLLATLGTIWVNRPACRSLDERDWMWFGRRNAWQAAFDCLSAACGAGLLTCDIDAEYTAVGRWSLTGLGLAGAGVFLAAGLAAARRLHHRHTQGPALPSTGLILATFLGLAILSVPFVWVLECLTVAAPTWLDAAGWQGSAWRALASVASLGWLPAKPPRACHWIYALVALFAGLGWMFWLLPFARARRRYLHTGCWVRAALTYLVFLGLLTTLIFTLEAPRGGRDPSQDDLTLTAKPAGVRWARSLIQTVCAATAGLPTESPADRHVVEGTKVALSAAMLVGSLGGAGSGIAWIFLLTTCLGPVLGPSKAKMAIRSSALLIILLTLVVALGLLLIDTHTASVYQPAPTFADAFLDAAAAVGGGNLTSGVAEAVTGRKLSRGISQPVDAYQYGMVWLMVAMLAGRLLPVFVLCQAARANAGESLPTHSTEC